MAVSQKHTNTQGLLRLLLRNTIKHDVFIAFSIHTAWAHTAWADMAVALAPAAALAVAVAVAAVVQYTVKNNASGGPRQKPLKTHRIFTILGEGRRLRDPSQK